MTDSLRRLISRRFSIWQKVLALAPVLLLAVSLPGQVLLRCQMDGLLRSSCCCPPEQGTPSSIPLLKAQGCCDQELTVNEPPVAESGRSSVTDLLAIAILAVDAPITLAAADAGRMPLVPRSHGPPRAGPSIVLLKHSFLI